MDLIRSKLTALSTFAKHNRKKKGLCAKFGGRKTGTHSPNPSTFKHKRVRSSMQAQSSPSTRGPMLKPHPKSSHPIANKSPKARAPEIPFINPFLLTIDASILVGGDDKEWLTIYHTKVTKANIQIAHIVRMGKCRGQVVQQTAWFSLLLSSRRQGTCSHAKLIPMHGVNNAFFLRMLLDMALSSTTDIDSI